MRSEYWQLQQAWCQPRTARSFLFGFTALIAALALTPLPAGAKTLSGKLTYDKVPDTATDGLDYNHITQRPIRNALVEVVDAGGKKIKDAVSENDGSYSLTIEKNVNAVKIRVLAETDEPKVTVKDNTNNSALYSLVSDVINTTAEQTTFNLNAPSGWNGTAYVSTRAAGPFACLDTIYTAAQSFVAVRPQAKFPALDVFWSVDNRPEDGNVALGQIGTSHYSRANTAMYILGKADVDTDEYDSHIMVHEWGHFFENKIGRSDSPGGTHGAGDIVDPRLAFGEGWGNALSGIILFPDSVYKDTSGVSQSESFSFDVEANLGSNDPHPGWFSESSVQTLLYDLFDPNTSESFDRVALGLGPIYDVMTGGEKDTPAFTTIFSFISALKKDLSTKKTPSQDIAAIDNLTAFHHISPVQDELGTGEANNGGSASNLPVYHKMTVGGANEVVTFLATVDNENRLGANRFIQFDSKNGGDVEITATSTSDISLSLYEDGELVGSADDVLSGTETISFKSKGKRTYVLLVHGFKINSTGTYNATVHIE